MLVDTYTSVPFGCRAGKTFLRKVLCEECGYDAWMVRLSPGPDGTEVQFERTVKGKPGDPSVMIDVRLTEAPVTVTDRCILTHEAGAFVHLLLDGWKIMLEKKATGSESSEKLGVLSRSLRAAKGFYSVTISRTVFHHGRVIISGACNSSGLDS